MPNKISKKIYRIPIVGKYIRFLKNTDFPGLKGLSIFRFFEIYITGIAKGAFSYRASAIAFSFFMAIFPFTLFILNLLPYIPLQGFQEEFLSFIEDSVPPNTYGAIEAIIKDILNNSNKSLISSGVFFAIIFMANGLNAILGGFQSSYHFAQNQLKRTFFRQFAVAILLSVLISFILILSVVLIVFSEYAIYSLSKSLLYLDELILIKIARSIIIIFLLLSINSILLKYGTKQTKYLPFFNAGSVISTLLMIVGSYGFGIYVVKFARYNELYGSIGTILVLMIYIWLICIIILLGFEVNASINSYKISNSQSKIDI